jgi:preprotein translocase subunit SecY
VFEVIKNAFKNPDLRRKILYTLMILVIFRVGAAIPAPFVDASVLVNVTGDGNNIFGYLNMLSGGAFQNATVFAMSITPYINASIIIQLLTVAIPALERLAKEGGEGRKKLNRITRYATVVIALLQATGYYFLMRQYGAIPSEFTGNVVSTIFSAATIILVFTAGAALIMWLGEQINEKGIGNGISIILFAGIVARGPDAFQVLWETFKLGGINYFLVPLTLVIFAAVIVFIIIMTCSERRIPVQYAKRVVGRKMYGGQSSYIPVKVSMSGVMPIIFASAFLSLPGTIQMFVTPEVGSFWYNFFAVLSPRGAVYAILYFLLIILFNYFYVSIQYNPVEIANNIKQNNGAIPGIRPGKPTVTFISKVISKITLLGAFFLGIIAIFPIIFTAATDINISLGGTSIIIIVGVALDTMRQLESQITMRHHKGFLE